MTSSAPRRSGEAGHRDRIEGTERSSGAGIYLYWIPLGAGGSGFVRMNGRIYEAIEASLQRRRPLDIYHTALSIDLGDERFIIETMWPCPDNSPVARGVVAVGPVFTKLLSWTRLFRYEVRCWRNGILPDSQQAVGGPIRLSDDTATPIRLLDLADSVPRLTWGRDELGLGEMWNSNSVVSWLITKAGIHVEEILPPSRGRAPGWASGVALASAAAPARAE